MTFSPGRGATGRPWRTATRVDDNLVLELRPPRRLRSIELPTLPKVFLRPIHVLTRSPLQLGRSKSGKDRHR
jgi:hypothetical protein